MAHQGRDVVLCPFETGTPIHSFIADNLMTKAIQVPVLTVIAVALAFAFHAVLSVRCGL